MRHCKTRFAPDRPVRLLRLAPILLLVVACGDDPPTEPAPPTATTIRVSPLSVTLRALDDTTRLTATVLDQYGQAMTGAAVTFSSSEPSVAAVVASGLVTAAGNGSATVTATSGAATGSATVTVIQVVVSMTVSPPSETIAPGDTLRLAAEALDNNGHVVIGAESTWSSTEPGVAVLDATGLVRGVAEGTATISITSGNAEATATITVVSLDRAALVAFYEATGGSQWIRNDNWLTDKPLGEWYGVRTDSLDRVDLLDLSTPGAGGGPQAGVGLVGSIPPQLGNLERLKFLDLSANGLSGEIPPELGNLRSLEHLGLVHNKLTGPVPPELGNLTRLKKLWLGFNGLTGQIPGELGNLSDLFYLWLSGNQLEGSIPAEMGSLTNLKYLLVDRNQLAGPLPPELGRLTELEWLYLHQNRLTGPLPVSLGQLTALRLLRMDDNSGLCVPGIKDFEWFNTLARAEGSWCNAADIAVLESVYASARGGSWRLDDGWLEGTFPDEWHGVDTDSVGRVVELDLANNALSGELSTRLGELARLRVLRLGENADLGGWLPSALARLSLDVLEYAATGICVPTERSFRTWLGDIPVHSGTNVDCATFTDRDVLRILYDATGGPDWIRNDNWLTDAPLADWEGVEVDLRGRVTILRLAHNRLTGSIPPELGSLAKLTQLTLEVNQLTGEIPPELDSLAKLAHLDLSDNQLTGRIPPALGRLTEMQRLRLNGNRLEGPIPPELGKHSKLLWLFLGNNKLTGPIPPELGNLVRLEWLVLEGNQLTGPVPPDMGNLTALKGLGLDNNRLTGPIPRELSRLVGLEWLEVSHNPAMAGVLPADLTALSGLVRFHAVNTSLCAPPDAAFQSWLDGIIERMVAQCALSVAYLTQAVQSRSFPVPLVAGEDALMRVFVTAVKPGDATLPPVRARFYLNGSEAHVAEIPARHQPIPTEVDEGNLDTSVNATIPGAVVQPGLEMVIYVDPDGTLDPALGVTRRIPDEGRQSVEVHALPLFDLTVIPFLWSEDPDSAVVSLAHGMADDPQGHQSLRYAVDLLPIGALEVTAHAPVLTDTKNKSQLSAQTKAIRAMEGNTGYYLSTMSGVNLGGVAGRWTSYSDPVAEIIAHELGHNFSLRHAPCGGPLGVDPLFPQPEGRIDVWGYANRELRWSDSSASFHEGQLVLPSIPDLMSYCGPRWISAYHFAKALGFRVENQAGIGAVGLQSPSLLLWGGADSTGTPYLEPAFVVDALPALPSPGRQYDLTGRNARGDVLFSLTFDMPPVSDGGEGLGSFAYVLPIRPGWAESLASISLSGDGGTVILDGDTNQRMAIYRDSATGQVRGFLRGRLAQADAVLRGLSEPQIEVLSSTGVPFPGLRR